LYVQSPLGVMRVMVPAGVIPYISFPFAEATPVSFAFDALRTSPIRRSRRRG
jgi:hypothetical protein